MIRENLSYLIRIIVLSLPFVIFLFLFLHIKGREERKIEYIEKIGIGVVLDKRDKEIAIQFKDSIFFFDKKEWYYLLEKGDSVEIKNGKIIKK